MKDPLTIKVIREAPCLNLEEVSSVHFDEKQHDDAEKPDLRMAENKRRCTNMSEKYRGLIYVYGNVGVSMMLSSYTDIIIEFENRNDQTTCMLEGRQIRAPRIFA